MAWKYLLLPVAAWAASGCLKFFVNAFHSSSISEARKLIGYGGFPSTHTAILSSTVFFTGFTLGFDTPVFTLGLGTLLVLMIDAHGLRRRVGEQARAINELRRVVGMDMPPLRERMGHRWSEIGGGILLGAVFGGLAAML